MGRQRKPRILTGILKDKLSLLKAIISLKRVKSTVIRATTHSPSPASDHCISAVVTIGEDSRQTARACVAVIVDRLHYTRDARVAIKCLILLHYIIMKGSLILKEQISVYDGSRNFLNLSRFHDGRDVESWNLSSWVKWYAGFLETNLSVSKLFRNQPKSPTVEIDELVKLVEEICNAPNDGGRNLTNEITSLVVEDYGSTQRQILERLGKFGARIMNGEVDYIEAKDVFGCLKRMEDCREKLTKMFGNRKRNDEFWEKVKEIKVEVEKMMDDKRIAAAPLLELPYRNSNVVSLCLI